MCPHTPPCPAPSAPDREAAHTIVSHPEQGWSLLCNGVVFSSRPQGHFRRSAAPYSTTGSHSATAATIIARCPFSACVSPGTTTTRSAS